MKRITTILASLTLLFSVSAASAQQSNLGFGLGISYPDAPDTVAFDSSLFFDYSVNKFFAIGVESGFGWIKKDLKSGDKAFEDFNAPEAASINYYSIPLLAVITISIPIGEYDSPLVPYISGGAGYSWTIFDGMDDNYTFSGFTWQAVVGFNYDLGYEANGMKIFLEAGWRGTDIEDDIEGHTYELEMSGLIAHIGASFALGGGSGM